MTIGVVDFGGVGFGRVASGFQRRVQVGGDNRVFVFSLI
jgi:hypothetical protein